MNYKPLVIFGPTSSGKTNIALQLARKFKGEIISADSRQVYKGLDIGTGKVSYEAKVEKHLGYWQVDGVKIHGFDLVVPGENFSAADFIKFANTTMIRIIEQHKLPIIVGGTGFYIKSLLDGIGSLGIPQNPVLRSELELLSKAELFKKLQKLNPKRAKSMNQSDRQNPRRLIRAIEIAQSFLTPSVSLVASKHTPGVSHINSQLPTTKYLLIGLTAPNVYLYNKSDQWLDTRINGGLVEEVNALLKGGVDKNWLKNLGLEYRWITKLTNSEIDKKNALESLKGDTHDFIRRQKTYFKKFKNIKLFDVSQKNWQNELEKTVSLWYTHSE